MSTFQVGFVAETLVDNGATVVVQGMRIKASCSGFGLVRFLALNALERHTDKTVAFTHANPIVMGPGINRYSKHQLKKVNRL